MQRGSRINRQLFQDSRQSEVADSWQTILLSNSAIRQSICYASQVNKFEWNFRSHEAVDGEILQPLWIGEGKKFN